MKKNTSVLARPNQPSQVPGYENKARDRLERENGGKQDFAIELAQQNDVQLAGKKNLETVCFASLI